MEFPVSYDITRIGSRVFSSTPNGVHRVDEALARYFLTRSEAPTTAAWFPRPIPHRLITREAALEVLAGVDAHFDENENTNLEPLYRSIRDWVLAAGADTPKTSPRIHHSREKRLGVAITWMLRHGIGAAASRAMPRDARYLNVSLYGLGVAGAFDWLAHRPDVKAVFFIHDMLPFETPEYFVPAELARHHVRMRNLARHGAGVVVSTHIVKAALRAHLTKLGRSDMPILVAPPPVAPIFHDKVEADDELAARPFFIQVGTIEPRKNHLMVLHVWRELVERHGAAAPKLVLVGARGWENENIIDLLDRASSLHSHVLEVSGLPTPVLRRLLSSARALLMPSFAEGYGLPLVEALAAGTPAIASDLPVFREVAEDSFVALGRIDAEGWLRAIEAFSGLRPFLEYASARTSPIFASRDTFFADVSAFSQSL